VEKHFTVIHNGNGEISNQVQTKSDFELILKISNYFQAYCL